MYDKIALYRVGTLRACRIAPTKVTIIYDLPVDLDLDIVVFFCHTTDNTKYTLFMFL